MLRAQRTQAINALRGHAAEFSVIAAKGTAQVAALLDKLAAEAEPPEAARAMFAQMGAHIAALDEQIAALNKELAALQAKNPPSQRLAKLPGIGTVAAVTLTLTVSAEHFASAGTLPPVECCLASRSSNIQQEASRASGRLLLWPTKWPGPSGP